MERPERVLSLQRGALALLHRQRRRNVLKSTRSRGKSSDPPARDQLLSNPSFLGLSTRSPPKVDSDAFGTTVPCCDALDLPCKVKALSALLKPVPCRRTSQQSSWASESPCCCQGCQSSAFKPHFARNVHMCCEHDHEDMECLACFSAAMGLQDCHAWASYFQALDTS